MLAIYARLSQDKGDNVSSIENQIHFGKEYANKLNLSYKVYKDVGVSGTLSIEKRPELFRMMQDIEEKEITHVFTYDQSRIERNNIVWNSIWLLFQQNNIKLYFHSGGEFNFDSPDSYLSSNVLSVFNSFFVKLTKQKVVNALQKNVETGKVHASPPFGYTKDSDKFLIINKEESEIVKKIYAMSLEGKGTDKIAEILNYEEVPTAYSKLEKGGIYKIRDRYNPNIITEKKKSDAKWRGRTIQGIIKNTIYKGKRFWKGNYYDVPAIFEETYWQKVNNNLQNNRNNTGKKVEHKYLLRGIIKCRCGRNMYGRSRVNKRDHAYICSSTRYKEEKCGNRGINIDKIENFVWEHFFIRKELLTLLNKTSNSGNSVLENLLMEKGLLEKKLKDNERGKQNLMDFIVADAITMADAKSRLEQIKNDKSKIKLEISEVELRISNLKDFEGLIIETKEDFKKYTLEADFEIKKRLIHKYIEKIIVAYQNRSSNSNHTYYIQIEFKNNIIKEKYVFNVDKGLIISLRDKEFKFLSDEGIVSIIDAETLEKSTFVHNNTSFYPMPFLSKESYKVLLKNVIFPYGNINSWNIEKIIDFYKTNHGWLSNESGINVNTEDKDDESYKWVFENYKRFKDRPIEDWVAFLYDTFKYPNN